MKIKWFISLLVFSLLIQKFEAKEIKALRSKAFRNKQLRCLSNGALLRFGGKGFRS